MAENQGPNSQNQGVGAAIDRFKALPKNVQYAVYGVFGFFVLMFLMRMGGSDAPPPPPVAAPQQQQQAAVARVDTTTAADDPFAPVQENREALRRGFISVQQRELEELRRGVREQQERQANEFNEYTRRIEQLQRQVLESMESLSTQMRLMEETNTRQREEISRLAEEARRQGLRPGSTAPSQQELQRRPRQRITQTPLGSAVSPGVGANQALLQGVLQTTTGQTTVPNPNQPQEVEEDPLPFMPPIGFVKGTMLNGVDALAVSGIATPSLVRIEGVYKTAHNSTVILDGCFMLVEFEGDISTERAKGKPSRMTCVYPDRGAVTYDVTGYVVDAEDGLEGVPGVFFEGDSGRIALAMAAQFASGIAQVVSSNQTTTTVNADGVSNSIMTGSQGRAAIAGGVSSSMSMLTSYLVERAERISPFIRVDATRKIHLVLLSGVQLRSEGDAWSLLFNAN